MTAPTMIVRACVECGVEFEFESAGDSLAGRFANAARRTCDPCIGRLAAAEEAREIQARFDRRLDASGIPTVFRTLVLDELWSVDPEVLDAARRWAAGDLDGLVLYGDLGVGKTTLAAAAALARLPREPVRWELVPSLVGRSFGTKHDREQVAATLTGSVSLVLDDIDKEKAGEWVAARLFSAIDNRLTNAAGLLVTMNRDVEGLAEKFGVEFGDAIASRLAGYCEIHEMTGDDRRLRGAA